MSMSNDALLAAHVESVKSGESAQTFADRIGMKLGSVNQRINSARGDLREHLVGLGLKTEDAEKRVNAIIPLRGRKGERKGERKEFLNSLVAQALKMQLETTNENTENTEKSEVLDTENPQL